MQNSFQKKDKEKILVRGISKSRPEAIGQLYDQYAAILYGVIFRLLSETKVAEKVLKAVFLEICRDIDQFNSRDCSLLTWMLQRTRKAALNHKNAINKSSIQEIRGAGNSVIGVERSNGIEEGNSYADQSPEETRDQDKVVWDFFYFQGLSAQDIAASTGLNLQEIKSLIRNFVQSINGVQEHE